MSRARASWRSRKSSSSLNRFSLSIPIVHNRAEAKPGEVEPEENGVRNQGADGHKDEKGLMGPGNR